VAARVTRGTTGHPGEPPLGMGRRIRGTGKTGVRECQLGLLVVAEEGGEPSAQQAAGVQRTEAGVRGCPGGGEGCGLSGLQSWGSAWRGVWRSA